MERLCAVCSQKQEASKSYAQLVMPERQPTKIEGVKKLEQSSENAPKEVFKNDKGKLRWSLLPVSAVEEIVKVLEFGAIKYGANQWRELPEFEWNRISDALERHLQKWKRGQDKDDESNLQEMAHVACNALFLLEMALQGLGKDDRFKYPKKGDSK
jgi:hypothetical protein